MPLDPLHAEMMVGVLGLDRIMRGNASFTLQAQEDAVSFPKRARALLLRALAAREAEPPEEPDFDYEEARKLLEADDDAVEARHNALYAELPDDIQDDVEAAATHVIGYLQAQLPRKVIRTTAREEIAPPEPFALDRFARQWRVAVDPMSALRAMAEGSLDMVMVAALEEAYPEIYKLVATPGGLLDDALAAMKMRRGDRWDVDDDVDRQVKILIGADPIDFELANDMAAARPTVPAPQPRAKSRPGSAGAIDELLPGQKQS